MAVVPRRGVIDEETVAAGTAGFELGKRRSGSCAAAAGQAGGESSRMTKGGVV